MADADTDAETDTDAPRSITPDHGRTSSPQMTVVGLVVAAGAALLLLPLLPFLAVLWVVAGDRHDGRDVSP